MKGAWGQYHIPVDCDTWPKCPVCKRSLRKSRRKTDPNKGDTMTLDAVKEAFDARRKANQNLEKELKKVLKFGSVVYWRHGNRTRNAMVMEVSGNRIKVRGDHTDYWINADRMTGV